MASWEELEPHLAALLDLGSDERERKLASIEDTDPILAKELGRLLLAAEQTLWDRQLSGGAADEVVAEIGSQMRRAEDYTGHIIDRYRLTGLLGRGGMGAVYLAERADGAYRRTAAVKLLPGKSLDSDAAQRFMSERQILAELMHPNIAQLLDGGITVEGHPYFVMEYVAGESLIAFCEHQQLELDARIGLFLQVLSAVSYAHSHLVVHGDLKPDNVLVNAEGTVKLLDFGVSTLLGRGARKHTGYAVALTPNYASPEQLLGQSVSTRSDVYALGAMLYCLITGRSPYTTRIAPLAELQSEVATRIPPAASDSTNLPGVDRELDCIIRKAIATNPEERYATVDDLRADLGRWQSQQPVHAHPWSRRYLARKFLQRHRLAVAASALVVVTLAGGVMATSYQAMHARSQAARATRVSEFMQSLFDAANPFGAWKTEKSVSDILDYANTRYQKDLADDPAARADTENMLGVAYLGNGQFERARELLQSALNTRLKLFGPDAAAVAESHNNLAYALIEQGSYDEGAAHANRALTIYTHHYGERSVPVSDALTNLAVATSNLGDRSGAQAIHERALAIREAALPGNHVSIADSQMSLAAVQAAQGDYSQVAALNQAAYERYLEAYGANHPMTVRALNGVASGQFLAGAYEAAADSFAELLNRSETRLGADHPELALLLNNLGRVHTELGRFTEARRYLDRAVSLLEDLDQQKMLAISTEFNRASVLAELGELESARAQLESARGRFTELLGADHPLTLRVRERLAFIDLLSGDLNAAAEGWRSLISSQNDSETNARTMAAARLGLARYLNQQASYEDALAQLELAAPVLERSTSEGHWRRTDLALERAIARRDTAAQRQLIRQLAQQLFADSPRVARARAFIDMPDGTAYE